MRILMLPLEGTPFVPIFFVGKDLSNPFFCPRFRLRASGKTKLAAFAFGVPHDINGFHPYTVRSANPFLPLPHQYPMRVSG